jgi:L-2,4-diaminobutyrate transaminase
VKDRDSRTFFDAGDKIGPQIAGALAAKGVIGRAMPQGDILGFAPPFCLSHAEADEIVEKTVAAAKEVLG